MDAVAEEVGVTKPAVYYHFDGKDALFEALFTYLWEQIAQSFLDLLNSDLPLEELLQAFFGSLADVEDEFASDDDSSFGMDLGYAPLIFDGVRRYPKIRQLMDDFYAECIRLLGRKVEEEKEAGTVRDDVDSVAIAVAVNALAEGLMLTSTLSEEASFRGREEQIARMLWRGIAREEDE